MDAQLHILILCSNSIKIKIYVVFPTNFSNQNYIPLNLFSGKSFFDPFGIVKSVNHYTPAFYFIHISKLCTYIEKVLQYGYSW